MRIVAGELKGRRITVPRGGGLRPTSERVREALFSILGERVVGARVLDAYSGTGALGLEAVSRGAAEVVFVEAEGIAAAALRELLGQLGVARRCRVVRDDAVTFIEKMRSPPGFDVVLADPPWDSEEGGRFLGALARRRVLADGGLVVLERAARRAAPAERFGELSLYRTARYGDCALDFFSCGADG